MTTVSIVARRYDALVFGIDTVAEACEVADQQARADAVIADDAVLRRAAVMVALVELLVGAKHSPGWTAMVDDERDRLPDRSVGLTEMEWEHLTRLSHSLQGYPDE